MVVHASTSNCTVPARHSASFTDAAAILDLTVPGGVHL